MSRSRIFHLARQPARQARQLGRWIGLGALVGVLSGAASALFLIALDRATLFRLAHQSIVYTLPLAGFVIGAIYQFLGPNLRGGYNLILDTLHTDGPQVPIRMAPMVLVGTVLTHLFGGSAGREGTAVQMGSSLADAVAHACKLDRRARRSLLASGIAGGFGSVFGTPIAGVIFGLEAVRVGRIEYEALLPALVAAVVGDLTTRALGVRHATYPHVSELPLTPMVIWKWMLFAAAIAAVTVAFIELLHRLKKLLERCIPRLPLRMALGGAMVIVLWRLSGTDDYLGLGVPTILRAFVDPKLPYAAFAWKLALTVVTLGAGFLGGEVTPLFFVGAALGNVLGRLLGLPLDLAAGVGLAAVFGAAANTPIALSIMAVELLGSNVFPHVMIVTIVAYLLTGHRGIYPAQRVSAGKLATRAHAEVALRDWIDDEHSATPSEGATPREGGNGERGTTPKDREIID